jgi:type VII secretion integral membrane protein EccD
VTGIRELGHASAMSAAPEHVRVSVEGGRTQLDVALPVDVPVASLVPELVKLVRSRDVDVPADSPWAATPHSFWTLRRVDPLVSLRPNETLRGAGVFDGELLTLTSERALLAPTLYDDVVDAAARLNKAAYAGWNAAAARWMSFLGLAAASLVWVYLLVNVVTGPQRAVIVALAVTVVAAMVGIAALAHRAYGQPDVGAVVGWCTVPVSAAIVWVLMRGFGDYAVAVGCGLLVVVNAVGYWAIRAGRWGYLACGVLFADLGLAMLGHAFGVPTPTVGVVLAVAAALGCLTVAPLTGRLARFEPSTGKPDSDRDPLVLENPFTAGPSSNSGTEVSSVTAMPTAEAVWARVRSAAITGSALYAGLAASVFCGVAIVLHGKPDLLWAALAFAGVCAAALGVMARLPGSAEERASLGVPAVAVLVAGCVSAQSGSAAVAWTGFGALIAVAVVASVAGLALTGRNPPYRWSTALAYLQYAVFAALIPVALWAGGGYAQLGVP